MLSFTSLSLNCYYYFSFQKAFKQIAATIKLCFVGLSTFVVEFVIVFGAFCCYFFFMLSPYMDTFRDISHSIQNTIAMAIGKFSFNSLRAASNFAAWIFFLFSGQRWSPQRSASTLSSVSIHIERLKVLNLVNPAHRSSRRTVRVLYSWFRRRGYMRFPLQKDNQVYSTLF